MKKLLLILMLISLLLCAACSNKEDVVVEEAYPVVIFTGSREYDPATWDSVQAQMAAYEDMIYHAELDDETLSDPAAYAAEVVRQSKSRDAFAVILAPAVEGSANAADQLHEYFADDGGVWVIFLNPEEDSATVAAAADGAFAARPDIIPTLLAENAADSAVSAVICFVENGTAESDSRALQLNEACTALEAPLNCIIRELPQDSSSWTSFIADEISSAEQNYGSCGFYTTVSAADAALLAACMQADAIFLGTSEVSPYHAYAEVMAVERPENLTSGLSQYLAALDTEAVALYGEDYGFYIWRTSVNDLALSGSCSYLYKVLISYYSAEFNIRTIRQELLYTGGRMMEYYSLEGVLYENYVLIIPGIDYKEHCAEC